ncbi:MAG: hypothetical protein ABIQ59_04430 [Nocardioidaceae bacterium]
MNTSTRTGLILLALLSVGDIAGLALTDGEHPPYVVAALGAALGVGSLYFVAKAWQGSRAALRPLFAMRIVSALTAVPAFFVDDVPPAALAGAAAIVVLTAVSVFLVGRAPVTKPAMA